MGSFPETPETYNDLFQHLSVVQSNLLCYWPEKTANFWPTMACSQKTSENDYKNSIVMTCHYSDLGSASDWMKQILNQSEALPRSE